MRRHTLFESGLFGRVRVYPETDRAGQNLGSHFMSEHGVMVPEDISSCVLLRGNEGLQQLDEENIVLIAVAGYTFNGFAHVPSDGLMRSPHSFEL